jgi:hypothetical protein
LFLTLDTETRGLFGEVFAAGIYSSQLGYYSYSGLGVVETVIERLLELVELYEEDLIVYCHNLEFDFSKMYADSEYLRKNTSWEQPLIINSRLVSIQVKSTTAKKKLIFKDSFSILPQSLDSLTKDFDVKHRKMGATLETYMESLGFVKSSGGPDKDKFFCEVAPDDKVLHEYMMYDTIGLHEVLSLTIEFSGLDEETFHKSVVTSASLAMKKFATSYPEDYDLLCQTRYQEGDEDLIRQAYAGGRVEVIRPRMNKGYHYDINSLYPYVMKTRSFPVGRYRKLTGLAAEEYYQVLDLKYDSGHAFIHAKVETDPKTYIPVLPYHEGLRLIFPVGEYSGWWTYDELHYALKRGTKLLEVLDLIYFYDTKPIFKEFIEECEVIKTQATGAKRFCYKLYQNSLYGKTGMKRDRTSFTLYSPSKEEKLLEKEKEYTVIENSNYMVKLIETIKYSRAGYIQPQVAAFVTSWARLTLYAGIEHVLKKGGEVYYYDTDSLVTSIPLPKNYVHEAIYGKWKLESVNEKGIFITPKVYCEIIDKKATEKLSGSLPKKDLVVKMKGVPKEFRKDYDYQKYEEILNKMQAATERQDNKALYPIFQSVGRIKFITAIKNNQDINRKVPISKGIKLNPKSPKRIMDYLNNNSKPVLIVEGWEDDGPS